MFEHTYIMRYGDLKNAETIKPSSILDVIQDVAIRNSDECGFTIDKMREIIEIQGGDPKVKADDLSFGPFTYDVVSSAEGIVVSVKNRALIDIARVA